jgi:hypothetical protein
LEGNPLLEITFLISTSAGSSLVKAADAPLGGIDCALAVEIIRAAIIRPIRADMALR